jgi:hypothetical protein
LVMIAGVGFTQASSDGRWRPDTRGLGWPKAPPYVHMPGPTGPPAPPYLHMPGPTGPPADPYAHLIGPNGENNKLSVFPNR